MQTNNYKQLDFRSFLLQEFDMTYNAFLTLLDCYKSQLRFDYEHWLCDGSLISDYGLFLKDKAKYSSPFTDWLKKRTRLSHCEFLDLSHAEKVRIYNQYWLEEHKNVEK